jgi:hypothetical protein
MTRVNFYIKELRQLGEHYCPLKTKLVTDKIVCVSGGCAVGLAVAVLYGNCIPLMNPR